MSNNCQLTSSQSLALILRQVLGAIDDRKGVARKLLAIRDEDVDYVVRQHRELLKSRDEATPRTSEIAQTCKAEGLLLATSRSSIVSEPRTYSCRCMAPLYSSAGTAHFCLPCCMAFTFAVTANVDQPLLRSNYNHRSDGQYIDSSSSRWPADCTTCSRSSLPAPIAGPVSRARRCAEDTYARSRGEFV